MSFSKQSLSGKNSEISDKTAIPLAINFHKYSDIILKVVHCGKTEALRITDCL